LEVIELSDPEKTKEAALSEEQSAEETKEASLPEGKPVEERRDTTKAPKPMITGDENISILKHGIYIKSEERGEVEKVGIEIAIRNVSDKMIGAALFEATFYDIEGNILDKVEHKTTELRSNTSRTIRIASSGPQRDNIESYNVRLVKIIMTPEPTATGNEKINILKHKLFEEDYTQMGIFQIPVELAIMNISASTIATAIFEATFYDIEGNILDKVEHKELDLKPRKSRAVTINSSLSKRETHKVKSYDIRVIRTTIADVERVQLRRHEIRTTETGEEEVRGVVKNISQLKTDAALVATFYDPKKENIGNKVIIFRDIEPNSIKRFRFIFKPQEGDIVRTYNLNIVCDVEEYK
jgi:hypothetical protein